MVADIHTHTKAAARMPSATRSPSAVSPTFDPTFIYGVDRKERRPLRSVVCALANSISKYASADLQVSEPFHGRAPKHSKARQAQNRGTMIFWELIPIVIRNRPNLFVDDSTAIALFYTPRCFRYRRTGAWRTSVSARCAVPASIIVISVAGASDDSGGACLTLGHHQPLCHISHTHKSPPAFSGAPSPWSHPAAWLHLQIVPSIWPDLHQKPIR